MLLIAGTSTSTLSTSATSRADSPSLRLLRHRALHSTAARLDRHLRPEAARLDLDLLRRRLPAVAAHDGAHGVPHLGDGPADGQVPHGRRGAERAAARRAHPHRERRAAAARRAPRARALRRRRERAVHPPRRDRAHRRTSPLARCASPS